ncbi:P-loop containing nucleoside triphosphate hydrolase protein [Gigaspora margarita]|uniref:P-loop containing nucleoside triphosphate hydrolase protein n=1 Tax=Gigaspora margarita TaxID=4874 RepID=A0A8H4A5J1_GIGMA|nr:P-loop containing nucleoside triphosphate hydrolase protein [Gigaspora margarita]
MAGLQSTMEMKKFEDLARVDGQHFLCNFHTQKLIAELIPMTIPKRFTFVTGPINTLDQRIMKNVQKLYLNPFIAHLYLWLSYKFSEAFVDVELAREMELKYETILHDSLQIKPQESDIRDVRKLNVTTKNSYFAKQQKITKNDTIEKMVPHKQVENS